MTARSESLTQRITKRVNNVRIERGFTVQQLADAMGLKFSTLSGYLSAGKRVSYNVEELIAFSEALEVPVSVLCPELVERAASEVDVQATRMITEIRLILSGGAS